MTCDIGNCLRIVAPFYNLVLVVIVVILFIKLLTVKNKGIFIRPWELLFFAICVYIVEQILAIIDILQIVNIHEYTFPILEMVMVSIFIYLLLLQKEYVQKSLIANSAKKK